MNAAGVLGDPAGGPVIATQTFFTLNGLPILRFTDPVTPHEPLEEPHLTAQMAEGSEWFTVNGLPICRTGHHANCGDSLIGSQEWFLVD